MNPTAIGGLVLGVALALGAVGSPNDQSDEGESIVCSAAPQAKLIGEIIDHCNDRILAAWTLCESLCSGTGVEEFDPGFCGVSSNCRCAPREDMPGIE